MKRVSFFFLLVFTWTIQVTAETISEQDAYRVAQQFFAHNNGLTKGISPANASLQLAYASTGYYAFNRGETDGFIIVAADDCFDHTVLGYADHGTFDTENMPANMRWWLGEYDRQLKVAQKNGIVSKDVNVKSAQSERVEITPLLTSQWNQASPYNNLCPIYDGQKCPTGCVATALAQIAYYYKYPEKGTGSHSYEWSINYVSQGTLSTDFSVRSYDFGAMTDIYNSSSSQASCDAVAQLMYDIGIASEMQYASLSSGTNTINGAKGMVRNFDYDKSVVVLQRNYYKDDEWVEILYSSLAESIPLYYSGVNNEGGHAFVLDGYRDGYFHINWGWGGVSDGYFLVDALDPMSQGLGGTSAGYNQNQEIILNLKPAQSNSQYTPLMYCIGEFDITKKEQTRTSNAIFSSEISGQSNTGGFLYYGMGTQHLTFGAKVVDADGAVTWIVSPQSGDYSLYSGRSKYQISLKDFPAGDGEYYVYPAYRDDDGNWYEMRTSKLFYKRYLIANASGNNIVFTNPPSNIKASKLEFGEWKFTNLVAGETLTAQVTVSNTGNADFSGTPVFTICASGTNFTYGIASSAPIELNVAAGASVSATFSMIALSPGGYEFVVANGHQILETGSFIISDNPKGNPTLVLNSINFANKDNVPLDGIDITAQITCQNSAYNGHLIFAVFSEDGMKNITRVTQPFSINVGETKVVKYQGSFSGLQMNTTYKFGLLHYTSYMTPFDNGVVMFTTASGSGIDEVVNDNEQPVGTSIYNLSGICLLHFEAGVPLDLSSLAPGIYIVKAGNQAKRIVVNN